MAEAVAQGAIIHSHYSFNGIYFTYFFVGLLVLLINKNLFGQYFKHSNLPSYLIINAEDEWMEPFSYGGAFILYKALNLPLKITLFWITRSIVIPYLSKIESKALSSE